MKTAEWTAAVAYELGAPVGPELDTPHLELGTALDIENGALTPGPARYEILSQAPLANPAEIHRLWTALEQRPPTVRGVATPMAILAYRDDREVLRASLGHANSILVEAGQDASIVCFGPSSALQALTDVVHDALFGSLEHQVRSRAAAGDFEGAVALYAARKGLDVGKAMEAVRELLGAPPDGGARE